MMAEETTPHEPPMESPLQIDGPAMGDLMTPWAGPNLPFFPMNQVRGDDLIWHYTDVGGLKGILENDEIWAGSTSMLNDIVEVQYGIWMLNDIWKIMRDQHGTHITPRQDEFVSNVIDTASKLLAGNGCFVVCGSLEADSLSVWRAYGPSGYAIGLRGGTGNLAIYSKERTCLDVVVNRMLAFRRVLYSSEEQMRYTNIALELIRASTPSDGKVEAGTDQWNARIDVEPLVIALVCVTLLKHPGFKDEREARLILTRDRFANTEGAISHRTGKFGIVPYLRLTGPIAQDESFSSRTAKGKLPIAEIMIGPCKYPDSAAAGLRSLLGHNGYDDVKVSRSRVPYR